MLILSRKTYFYLLVEDGDGVEDEDEDEDERFEKEMEGRRTVMGFTPNTVIITMMYRMRSCPPIIRMRSEYVVFIIEGAG